MVSDLINSKKSRFESTDEEQNNTGQLPVKKARGRPKKDNKIEKRPQESAGLSKDFNIFNITKKDER